MVALSKAFYFNSQQMLQSYNPTIAVTTVVWANPRSLATTRGITFVFSSCAYLDVSVQRVRFSYEMVMLHITGLPHSEILDYCGHLHLTQAFRSLSRPSSPLRA